MRVDLTVAGPAGDHDVVLSGPESAPLGGALASLAALAGAPGGGTLWLAERRLRPDDTVAAAGLRTGSVITVGRPGPVERAGMLSLHVLGGPAAGRSVALERGRVDIGRDPRCPIVLPDPDVSRRHAAIEVSAAGMTLRDLGSTNGTRLDGHPVPTTGLPLRPGALISVGDSLLSVAGPEEAPASVQPGGDGTLLVLRPPRHRAPSTVDEVLLPAAPRAARPHGVQWLAALLPALAGGILAWAFGSPQFLLFVLLSPVMMVGTALGDRLHWRRSRRRDAADFRQQQAIAQGRIADGLAAEGTARRDASPDPVAVLRQATMPGCRLWERRRDDPDALSVRLGVADLPSRLRARDGSASRPAGVLANVPLTFDLRQGPLGVAAPPAIGAGLARWVLGQLSTWHSPDDVELAVLLGADRDEQWAWLRWLPQLRHNVASTPERRAELVARLGALLDQRLAGRRGEPERWSGRWLVLLIDRAGELAEIPGLAALLDRGRRAGITAVCLDHDVARLPTACAGVLRSSGETGTRLALRTAPDPAEVVIVADRVSEEWAARLARALAPLRDVGTAGGGGLPDSCGLLDVLELADADPAEIAGRWARSAGTARATIGRSSDGPLTVDLVTDGPHALVAGTTGAGKSELLQALVTTLAAHQPPDELTMLLIDYKGGAAFGECARLPHTAGLVTDLDPYLTERALRSLHSELRRRERLFAEVGAVDLAAYRAAAPLEPLARLVIVVDEFAALAEELPDFVHGLVGVAQRGRSLGIHLVLATQRPGTAVSADIRANTALRIALRVTDAAESSDVIDAADAALLDAALPGRGYLRAGQALIAFQAAHAAHVTAADPGAMSVEPLGPWRRRSPTGRDPAAQSDVARLAGAIAGAARLAGQADARAPWLPPLPMVLGPSDVAETDAPACVPVGLVDLPDEQRRATYAVDLRRGAAVLGAGTARSGRTALLRRLAVGAADRLPPDRLHLHVVDSAGRLCAELRPLPHCATVLGPEDIGLAPRLLRRLERECIRRLAEAAAGDPLLLLLVDGWDALAAGLPDIELLACNDTLANVLRIAPAAGLSIAVTGDRTTLAPRFAGGFSDRLVFRLADRGDYATAGIDPRAVPGELPRGRAVRAADGAALQIAEPIDVREVAAKWAGAPCPGSDAVRVRPLPARLQLADLRDRSSDGRLVIGLAGDERVPFTVDPFAGAGRLLVAGPPRSGRTTVLRTLAEQAAVAGIDTVVAAPARSPLVESARRLALRVVAPDDHVVDAAPAVRTLLVVDDAEAFTDAPAGDALVNWLRRPAAPLAAVVAGRSDDLATSYRGIGAEVRRAQCGILLRPGPVDGELLGARLPRRPASGPPGRGVAVGEAAWGALFEDGEPVPVQVAMP